MESVWYHLACCLSKGALKGDVLEICLTRFFGIRNFGNTSAMRGILFLKMFKFYVRFQKCSNKFRKRFFYFLGNFMRIGCELVLLTWYLRKGPLKQDLLKIFFISFSESVISEMHQLWGSSFFWKCSKFNKNSKNVETKSEKFFCFRDNIIWIGCLELYLLWRKYLSSVVNMITNLPKTLYIAKRYFFQLNSLQSDQ